MWSEEPFWKNNRSPAEGGAPSSKLVSLYYHEFAVQVDNPRFFSEKSKNWAVFPYFLHLRGGFRTLAQVVSVHSCIGAMMRGTSWRQRKRARPSSKLSTKSSLVTVSKKQVDQNQSRVIQRLVKLTRGIAPERKFFDTSLSFINVADTAGAIVQITSIAQGDTVGTRTGNKIRIKALYVQVRVSTQSLAGLAEEYVRFMVVQDMQQVSDTAPTVANIVNNTALPQNALPLVASQGRYRILHTFKLFDGQMLLASNATQSSTQTWVKYGLDIPVTYNDTASSDIQKNGIYVICYTNEPTDVIDCDGLARVTFVDD